MQHAEKVGLTMMSVRGKRVQIISMSSDKKRAQIKVGGVTRHVHLEKDRKYHWRPRLAREAQLIKLRRIASIPDKDRARLAEFVFGLYPDARHEIYYLKK